MEPLSEKWIRIADEVALLPFNEKNIAPVQIGNRKICIVKTPDGIRACSDICPHAGGSLSQGYVDQHNNIVCCVHNYKFNLKTGRDALNEGYFLKTFRVLVSEEGVFIEMK